MPTDLPVMIRGYASRFDERDAGGDRVRYGAFSASLLSKADLVPMLSDHQHPVGRWTRMREDKTGLWVEGEVSDPTLARLIRRGSVSGLSIGYQTRRFTPQGSGRDLHEIDLREVSLVAFPMLRSARFEAVTDPPATVSDTRSETQNDTYPQTNQRSSM